MREIYGQYLKTPWYGARQMMRHLIRMGHEVGRKRIRRLMLLMGLRAIAPGPETSRRGRGLHPRQILPPKQWGQSKVPEYFTLALYSDPIPPPTRSSDC